MTLLNAGLHKDTHSLMKSHSSEFVIQLSICGISLIYLFQELHDIYLFFTKDFYPTLSVKPNSYIIDDTTTLSTTVLLFFILYSLFMSFLFIYTF